MSWAAENDVHRWCGRFATVAVLVLGIALGRAPRLDAAAEKAAGEPPRLGMLIRISLPITGQQVERVERFVDKALEKAREDHARPVLIFQFDPPADPGQDEFAASTDYHDASKLADLLSGEKLNQAQTVAYIPKAVTGHAVLVALACDQIMMAEEAEFGPVGAEAIRPSQRSVYAEIADSRDRKTISSAVALWLLDPSLNVLKVETNAGREFVLEEDLKKLRKKRTIDPQQTRPLRDLVAGRPGQFNGKEGWRLGFVDSMPPTAEKAAKALGLPPAAMKEDTSLVRDWKPVRVDLKGPIKAGTFNQVHNLIEKQIRTREVNFICLWIDSAGGSADESLLLAGYLASLRLKEVYTAAYVPAQARSDAVLIALACDQVVMNPDAELGGPGEYLSPDDVEFIRQAVLEENSSWKSRPQALVTALIDPGLEVFRCERLGEVRYLTEDEWGKLPDKDDWTKNRLPGARPTDPLLVAGTRAVEYGLADHTAGSFAEFNRVYGLKGDMMLAEPGWVDFLIEALASPGVSALLLTIAFIAMYAELNAPGIGIGGFVATVCFLLFFWAHYLGHTAGWLEVILFVAGVGCLLLEVFVLPGFGIFGLGGGCLVLISLILASQTFVLPQNTYQFGQLKRSLLTIAAAGVGIVAALALLRRYLPHAPLFNQVILTPPAGEEAEDISRREALINLDDFVGNRGTTTTQLTPSGKARFGDMLIDVITDGDVLSPGTDIEVVEVHGNRVIVKEVDSG